ncbi:MAG: phosphomannomutase/phosphoglucomutase [Oscillospiraceae bacterium]|jgi:phosphomannomutase|nr:phosphomannomutase/phosphoglucomutase [Oscillospiraceae bacterium]
MAEEIWKKLKSGSDIRGTAVENENNEMDLTKDVIKSIVLSFSMWLARFKNVDFSEQIIALGHDSRVSSRRIKNTTINALRSIGVSIYDCSLASTPAMSMAMKILSCNAAIQITASHHPYRYNGFKFFLKNGTISHKNIEEILEYAKTQYYSEPKKIKGIVRTFKVMKDYCQFIKNLIINKLGVNEPLKGFHVVVDAGEGVGSFFVSDILDPLGADTRGSILLEPSGKFSEHEPNPEDSKAIDSIKGAVLKSKADLGIIFDCDVDRVAVVDSDGTVINGSLLVALASALVLRENPGAVIVTDSVTPPQLKKFISEFGGIQFRYKRGYSNVILAAKEINDSGTNCPLAIETSGHAAFKEYGFIDDGSYLAAKIVAEAFKLKSENKTISDLIKTYKPSLEHKEIRIPLEGEEPADVLASDVIYEIKQEFIKIPGCEIEKDNAEGIRLNFTSAEHDGWCILRKSVHDPALVVTAESNTLRGSEKILESVKHMISKTNF